MGCFCLVPSHRKWCYVLLWISLKLSLWMCFHSFVHPVLLFHVTVYTWNRSDNCGIICVLGTLLTGEYMNDVYIHFECILLRCPTRQTATHTLTTTPHTHSWDTNRQIVLFLILRPMFFDLKYFFLIFGYFSSGFVFYHFRSWAKLCTQFSFPVWWWCSLKNLCLRLNTLHDHIECINFATFIFPYHITQNWYDIHCSNEITIKLVAVINDNKRHISMVHLYLSCLYGCVLEWMWTIHCWYVHVDAKTASIHIEHNSNSFFTIV